MAVNKDKVSKTKPTAYEKMMAGASKEEYNEAIEKKTIADSSPIQKEMVIPDKVKPVIERATPLIKPLTTHSAVQSNGTVWLLNVGTGKRVQMGIKAAMGLATRQPNLYQIVQ